MKELQRFKPKARELVHLVCQSTQGYTSVCFLTHVTIPPAPHNHSISTFIFNFNYILINFIKYPRGYVEACSKFICDFTAKYLHADSYKTCQQGATDRQGL